MERILEKEPKVLVFASCYNHGKYVAEAIESVLNQTYKNIEFLVINDGSTDNSAEIIKQYIYDERLTFINLIENTSAVGAFKIINDYIKKSDAKYIASMSTDDKWRQNKLEKQINFLENNSTYKACFTWDEILIEDDAINKDILPQGYSHVQNMDRFKNLYRLLMYCNFYNAVSVVISRKEYVEVGGFNWTYRNVQDYELWIRFQMKYPVYLMEENLTYYRRHGTNLSGTSTTFMRDRNEVLFIYFKLMTEIDDITFKRIFFKDFVYYDSNTCIEIMAEKIAMLMRKEDHVWKQVAFFLYMDNSNNTKLMKLLETKYMLDSKMFHKLTGSYGMEYLLLDYKPEVAYNFNKFYALLKFVSNPNKSYSDLYSMKYDALKELMNMNRSLNHNIDDFQKIRNYIWDYQKTVNNNKVKMLVIAEEYIEKSYDIVDFVGIADYIAILPRNEKMFIDKLYKEPNIDFIGERIYLYDAFDHRIQYLWEVGADDVSEIIFYGCCNNDYPITDVIDNVSLAVALCYFSAENDDFCNTDLEFLLQNYSSCAVEM